MPYLINPETRLALKATEAGLEGTDKDYVVWDANTNQPVVVTDFPMNTDVDPELFGTHVVNGLECKSGGQLLKESCEEWTLEKAAEICWLDAAQIEKALEIYTDPDGQSAIMQGVAIDQYPQSQQSALGALNLEFLMGNVEKPGAMLQKFASAPCKVGQHPASAYRGEGPQALRLLGAQRPHLLGHGAHPQRAARYAVRRPLSDSHVDRAFGQQARGAWQLKLSGRGCPAPGHGGAHLHVSHGVFRHVRRLPVALHRMA